MLPVESLLVESFACVELLIGALKLPRYRAEGRMMGDFFAPQSSIVVSDAWNDGTSTFLSHLKEAFEKHTLLNVWVYGLGINQVMSAVCCVDRFRLFLCQIFYLQMQTVDDDVVRRLREALYAAIVIILCLKPTYITRTNCLRVTRWSLDFSVSAKKRVILLPLHRPLPVMVS